MTEQPEVWTHCFMCGHPVEAHDRDDDGNRPCRSPGHPKGVPCSDCRALLTTEYREHVQDVREEPGFDEAWNAFLITRGDAQHQFGEHAPAFFTDIYQSALASALIHYRQTLLKPLTDLHTPVQHLGQTWCSECSVRRSTGPHGEEWVAYIPHPCPTIDSLQGESP